MRRMILPLLLVVGSLLSFAPLSSAQDAAPSVALTSPQVGVLGTRLRRQENEVATKTAFRA